MKRALASAVKRALLHGGHYRRRLRSDTFPGVAVLCYHGVRDDDRSVADGPFAELHVSAAELDAHCRVIRETCHPIGLAEWRAALAGGAPLPARPVLFTFDDGYRSLYTVARPILERHAIRAVAFVCSDVVARRRLLWYDAVAREGGRAEAERIKELPYAEWEQHDRAREHAAADEDPDAPLTIEEIGRLSRGAVEIGAHTESHAILAHADREQQRIQIARNKSQLEAWIGGPVRAFAYPDGRPMLDYTRESVELVAELGFDFAFTTREGFATNSEPPLERSRFMMLAGISATELAHRLTYSWRG